MHWLIALLRSWGKGGVKASKAMPAHRSDVTELEKARQELSELELRFIAANIGHTPGRLDHESLR